MADATARQKFACPTCGGEAVWNPAQGALVCSYCGSVSPARIETTTGGGDIIVEHDLAAALRGIPDSARGWQARKTSVRCQSCQAISVFDESRVGQRCEFCGSSALLPYEEIKESFRPESLLPLKIAETQVRDKIRQWYGSRWFAPNALASKALTDTIRGVYLPYWTFDALVRAEWTAESGYYYYVTERVRDANGEERNVQVRKIRWEPSAGQVEHFFDDELVCASRGVDPSLVPRLQWPTKDLVPYDAGFLSGWIVERYQVDLVSAARHARETMEAKLRNLCAARVPGDTYQNLQIHADWSGQTFKHILMPVWLLSYQYHGRTYQVVIDGYQGQIAGHYPRSFWKILLLVVAILAFIGLIIFFGHQ